MLISVTSGTYGCRLGEDAYTLNCKVMWYTITKIICGFSVFAGIILAFLGHRYYMYSQFIFGTYASGLLAFIFIVVVHNGILVSYTEQVGLSVAIGIIGEFSLMMSKTVPFERIQQSCLLYFRWISLDGGLVFPGNSTPEHISISDAHRIPYGQHFCLFATD